MQYTSISYHFVKRKGGATSPPKRKLTPRPIRTQKEPKIFSFHPHKASIHQKETFPPFENKFITNKVPNFLPRCAFLSYAMLFSKLLWFCQGRKIYPFEGFYSSTIVSSTSVTSNLGSFYPPLPFFCFS